MDGDGLSDGDSGESMVENFTSKSTECEGVLNARYGLSACHAVHTSSPRFHTLMMITLCLPFSFKLPSSPLYSLPLVTCRFPILFLKKPNGQ